MKTGKERYGVLYKCVCEWFETPRKGDMRRHLQRYGCIDEEDIDILCSTRINRDLSHLDKEERLDLWKKENREKDQIKACPGGRCAYLGIPIYLEKNHKYKTSIERIDPTKGYGRNNIALIVSSLNGRPIGRYNNKNITNEERKTAVETGALGFNVDKLNKWLLLTPERKKNTRWI
jgi:hypothetical protein